LASESLVNHTQQMDDFCKEKGFAKWFETSAKENINIEASSRFLVSEVKSFSYVSFNLNTHIFFVR
jgi:Ras-related protein Rab-32